MLSRKAARASRAPSTHPHQASKTSATTPSNFPTSGSSYNKILYGSSINVATHDSSMPSSSSSMTPSAHSTFIPFGSSTFLSPSFSTTASASTTQSARQVNHLRLSLLDMPGEIRDKIWTMALGGEREIHIGWCEDSARASHHHPFVAGVTGLSQPNCNGTSFKIDPYSPRQLHSCLKNEIIPESQFLNLLLTNRQIASEATFVLYNKNVFSFHYFYDFAEFLRTLGELQRSYLKTVSFNSTFVPWKRWRRELPFPTNINLDTICLNFGISSDHFENVGYDALPFTKPLEDMTLLVERMGWTTKKISQSLVMCERHHTYVSSHEPPEKIERLLQTSETQREVCMHNIRAAIQARNRAVMPVEFRLAEVTSGRARRLKALGKAAH